MTFILIKCYNETNLMRGSDAVRAYNFWIYLARFYSGMLNAGMLLSIGTMLTLHTGNLTRVSINTVLGQWDQILYPSVAIIAYLVGVFMTGAYYGTEKRGMTYRYWQGYAFIGILFFFLWLLPISSLPFLIILSAAMGIFCSMPLPNRAYTGTITMMTGLMTELVTCLSYWLIRKSKPHKSQSLYLANNLVAYILGAFLQTFHYTQVGLVKAWPLMLMAFTLSAWAYRFGDREMLT